MRSYILVLCIVAGFACAYADPIPDSPVEGPNAVKNVAKDIQDIKEDWQKLRDDVMTVVETVKSEGAAETPSMRTRRSPAKPCPNGQKRRGGECFG